MSSLSAESIAVLRIVRACPLITGTGINSEMKRSVSRHLGKLVQNGHLQAREQRQISGRVERAYSLTDRGRRSLEAAITAPSRAPKTAPRAPSMDGTYTCPELGKTCDRPGAYDAFGYPSLIAGERHFPRGIAC